jgi:hypothetical protein
MDHAEDLQERDQEIGHHAKHIRERQRYTSHTYVLYVGRDDRAP